MMPSMSLDDCSGPDLKCWIKNCRFKSITQKGLTTHLQSLHGIEYRERIRPAKGARSRRKIPVPRDVPSDPWSRAFVCSLCNLGCASKQELLQHNQQVHNCGATCSTRAVIPNSAAGNPGCSGRPRSRPHARPDAPYSFYRCQPESHCNRGNMPMYDQYYVNQIQLRPEDFHEQAAPVILQEPVPQDGHFDRAQMHDAQRSTTEWTGYRTSVQTPQAMSAEFASSIQGRSDDNANSWIPQASAQRIDDSNIQLWSNAGQMTSFQYDLKKEPVTISDGDSGNIQPCTQCGCASRGGCTQRTDVNRIILVEEGNGGAQNGTENHEVYHLQDCSGLGNFRASNVKQVVDQGNMIVLQCHTEDGREVVLKALRAAPETEEAVERNDETSALTLTLASSPMNGQGIESDPNVLEGNNFNQNPPMPEDESQSSASIVQPAEESMQSTLPQLFPELFEDCMVGSDTKSVSWHSEDTDEADSFFEVCKRSEYLAALSNCRGVRDDSGSLHLKCGQCSYCTDIGDPLPLEQLQIHISAMSDKRLSGFSQVNHIRTRKHMDKSFQCRKCEFGCLPREEMLVHVGTQHDVAKIEPLY